LIIPPPPTLTLFPYTTLFRSLGDQFSYALGTGSDGTIGAYLSAFRKSFAVVGLVVFDAALMADVDERAVGSAMEHAIEQAPVAADRKSTRLNSSHQIISYAVF